MDLGENIWKKGIENTISGHFRGVVPVPNRVVPVPKVLCQLFWTSVCILAITWSFLIRFELFKLLVKLNFKEDKTS